MKQNIDNFEIPEFPDVFPRKIRLCHGFYGYAITDDGQLWSCRPLGKHSSLRTYWRPLKFHENSDGYRATSIRKSGLPVYVKASRLVAEAFLGPRPDGHEVCHIDGNKTNDTHSNLKWGTHSENILDAVGHGKYVEVRTGSKNPNAKLTTKDIEYIRTHYSTKTYAEIASMFSVHEQTIGRVVRLIKNGLM